MESIKIVTRHRRILADTLTPVSVYLKLRDQFANSILLESSEYQSLENNYSYICCEPMASIRIQESVIRQELPDGSMITSELAHVHDTIHALDAFVRRFSATQCTHNGHICNGLFGYLSYDAVEYFESIKFRSREGATSPIPSMQFSIYRFVIVIDHFKNEMHLYEHTCEPSTLRSSTIETVLEILNNKSIPAYPFRLHDKEDSNLSDEDFMEIIREGKRHCQRGDVFQIVLSRKFTQKFSGDEFQVYRALRSINPGPYLFYFDYGNFRLFGASPEAQLTVRHGIASIYPIAGTYPRTGDTERDKALLEELKSDHKENAEHVMLVDLARNDLSRHAGNVHVAAFREIQQFSHVMHMTSRVDGTVERTSAIQLLADTFPAGTLSGAPKYKAMELIDRYEPTRRGYYGGSIGFIGFDETVNHAIMIRTFFSANNTLTYQAGAGIVVDSDPARELQEVNHKIAALRKALQNAENI